MNSSAKPYTIPTEALPDNHAIKKARTAGFFVFKSKSLPLKKRSMMKLRLHIFFNLYKKQPAPKRQLYQPPHGMGKRFLLEFLSAISGEPKMPFLFNRSKFKAKKNPTKW